MDDHSDLFLNRKKLVQTLYVLSGRQLARFREQFPTPIYDNQIETALKLAMGYPKQDNPNILQPRQRKAQKKMYATWINTKTLDTSGTNGFLTQGLH